MKSASRAGSWMLAASVASSSERVGESSTTRWKKPRTLCASAADLDLLLGRDLLADELDAGPQERPVLRDLQDPEALDALHDEPQRAVREAEHLVDVGERADREEVALDRIVDRRGRAG